MDFTAYLWLNWIVAGFLFGAGWFVANAVCTAIVGVLSRGKTP